MHIGLYFGSFNPIHNGHLIIANHIAEHCGVDKVWFVVSPQNPLKESKTLLNEYDRLHLVKIATKDNPKLGVSDIEFKLPRPSYTIDTLTYLQEQYPLYKFSVIMGSDSFQNLQRWKNYEQILKHYALLVYERPGFPVTTDNSGSIQLLKAPMLDISATYIRKEIRAGKSIRYLCPEEVYRYIEENRYYK